MADFAKHRGIRRAKLIYIVAVSFLVSQLVGLGVQDIEHLQYPVFLVGISYGAAVGLLAVIVIEWFGTSMCMSSLLLELPELIFLPHSIS
jgi:hypothetical protein